jgi:hypothetical protein
LLRQSLDSPKKYLTRFGDLANMPVISGADFGGVAS